METSAVDARQVDDTAISPTGRQQFARHYAYVFLIYAGLAILLFFKAWSSPASTNIGGLGDPAQTMWFLRWTPYAIAHGANPFLTNHLNYPAGVNLTWNTPVSLIGFVLAPVTLTLGPIVSYNTFVTLDVALSAWTAYFAIRRFVGRKSAAFVGGCLYGFSPYMMTQAHDHANLAAAFLPPLLLVLVDEIFVRQRQPAARTGLLLGLVAAAQLLVSEELLATEAIAGSLALGVLLIFRGGVRSRVRHAAKALLCAVGVFAYFAVWPLWEQFFGPQRIHGTIQASNTYVTDLANLVVPTSSQLIAPRWAVAISQAWTGLPTEWDGYIGLPLIALLVIAAVRYWSSRLVRTCGLVALLLIVLSLGPRLHVAGHDTHIWLPWSPLDSTPLVKHALPARLMLYVDLLAAVIVAVFVDRLPGRERWRRGLPGVALLILALASVLPTFPYPAARLERTKFFTSRAVDLIPAGTVALIAPFQQLYPSEPMLWQAEAGMRFRMPQGYFLGPDPSGRPMYGAQYSTLSTTMEIIQDGGSVSLTADLRRAIAQDLQARDVRTVVVGPMGHQDEMLAFFASLFGRAPAPHDDVFAWTDVPDLIGTLGRSRPSP
jgi:hypothetical protein